MLHGPGNGAIDLQFEVPSACADSVASGAAGVGIIPVVEMRRLNLPYVPGLGIASNGPVRSIFLISREPADRIATVAMDTSSRTSVALAKIILDQKYGNRPRTIDRAPDLDDMMQAADAALIIGDPALRLDLTRLPYRVYDLGREWTEWTGLPMVYAVWAGPQAKEAAPLLRESYEYGRERIDEVIAASDFPHDLTREYLTKHIVYELTADYELGMELFLSLL
jgi:chorismate dehydratase